MLMILPKGGLRSAIEWRGLEMELDLINALRVEDR